MKEITEASASVGLLLATAVGSDRSNRLRLVSPLHVLLALPIPACLTAELSTVEDSSFVK